ncbi:MAG: hypothetical protein AAF571_02820 [Verrucomicrobiota bacterium]
MMILGVLALSLCVTGDVLAEKEHKHSEACTHEEKIKSPNGGRMIELEPYHVEFYATPERMIQVRFYDHDMKPVQLDQAQIQVVAQAESGTQKYDLLLKEGVFLSDQLLPEGESYHLVLRIKTDSESSFKNIRFLFDPSICSDCKLGEYACTCEGHNH